MCQEQGTFQWWLDRLCKITASNGYKILTEPRNKKDRELGLMGDTHKTYLMEIISERLTSIPAEKFKSKEMLWGTLNEPLARVDYQKKSGNKVETCGAIQNKIFTGDVAGSPDGLVGSDGMIEIKCPNTKTHIETLLTKEINSNYIIQMQFNMWNCERNWCDFVSYDPRCPEDCKIFIKRIYADSEIFIKIENSIIKSISFMNEIMEKLTGKVDWEIEEHVLREFLIDNYYISDLDLDMEGIEND